MRLSVLYATLASVALAAALSFGLNGFLPVALFWSLSAIDSSIESAAKK